jgi:hypothetical protein
VREGGLTAGAATVLVCLCVGVSPLCLLNGQTFTNSLIALPFFSASIVLCAAFALDRRTPEDRRRAWRLATMLTALLAISILLTLPSAYRSQQGFNKAIQAIHRGPPGAIKPGP